MGKCIQRLQQTEENPPPRIDGDDLLIRILMLQRTSGSGRSLKCTYRQVRILRM